MTSTAIERSSSPPATLPQRPWYYRMAKKGRHLVNRAIARSSRIGTAPELDPAEFPWTAHLARHWRTIRDEAQALLPKVAAIPPLRLISPDHRRIEQNGLWRSFFLYGYGYKVEANCARCPETTRLVETIPGLVSAFFSILLPGTHIRPHRGPTKALVTCHLGLDAPPAEQCLMHLEDDTVAWREGEWLVFDDTYRHEVRNDSDRPRIILLIHVRRPLRFPGNWLASLFVAGMRITPFVQEGRRNIAGWDQALAAGDTAD